MSRPRLLRRDAATATNSRTDVAQKRAVADIYPATPDARRDNSRHNTLEKSLK